MFKPWITVPVEVIRVSLPANPYDREVTIMFRDVEAVDKTIEQLKNLRELLTKIN